MDQHITYAPRRNLHPADELGEVRDMLRQLRARESELRREVLALPATSPGRLFDVNIRTQRRRVFLKERLPQDILDQPVLWETRVSRVVTLRKRSTPIEVATRHPSSVESALEEDDFQVIEPF